jgi:putative aldouronate transport system permease protein
MRKLRSSVLARRFDDSPSPAHPRHRARGAGTGQNRMTLRKRFRGQGYYYLMLAIPIAWYIVFSFIPMAGLVIAFKDYRLADGIFGSKWVGLRFFEQIFTDYYSKKVLINTVGISFYKLLVGFPAPILFALLLNELRLVPFKKVTQTISYLPYFISWVVIIGIWRAMLSVDGGVVNNVLVGVGILDEPISFILQRKAIWPLAVLTEVWKNLGWNSIIYIAAIAGINPELYEAAAMDGATRFRRVWNVTLPGIRPTIVILLIFSIGSLFSGNFDQMYMLGVGPVQDAAEIIDTYIYRQGLQKLQFSLGTAASLLRSILIFLLVALSNAGAKAVGEEGVW